MNKHDYMHMFKAINQHLMDAKTHCTQNHVLDHIEKAKEALWVVADDIGIELITEGD
jgi:hypothetical protein